MPKAIAVKSVWEIEDSSKPIATARYNYCQ
jgi:hypothetical protein